MKASSEVAARRAISGSLAKVTPAEGNLLENMLKDALLEDVRAAAKEKDAATKANLEAMLASF